MINNPRVVLIPLGVMIGMIFSIRELVREPAVSYLPGVALAFGVFGLLLRRYSKQRWIENIGEHNRDVQRYYWNPRIHWTEKLVILQQRTGAFTLFAGLGFYVLAVFCVGCWVYGNHTSAKQRDVAVAESHERVAAEAISLLKQTNATLERIKTAEDARDASRQLDALAEKWQSLKERATSLAAPEAAEKNKLANKYGHGFRVETQRFQRNDRRIAAENELSAPLTQPLAKIRVAITSFRT